MLEIYSLLMEIKPERRVSRKEKKLYKILI